MSEFGFLTECLAGRDGFETCLAHKTWLDFNYGHYCDIDRFRVAFGFCGNSPARHDCWFCRRPLFFGSHRVWIQDL